jgi:hypothetical protein
MVPSPMKYLVTQLTFAGVMMISTQARSADPVGELRICREPGVVHGQDGRAITIPRGARFGALMSSRDGTSGGPAGMLIMAELVEDVVLAPDTACAAAKAVLLNEPGRAPLLAADHRTLRPAGMAPQWPLPRDPPPREWEVSGVFANALQDFR